MYPLCQFFLERALWDPQASWRREEPLLAAYRSHVPIYTSSITWWKKLLFLLHMLTSSNRSQGQPNLAPLQARVFSSFKGERYPTKPHIAPAQQDAGSIRFF